MNEDVGQRENGNTSSLQKCIHKIVAIETMQLENLGFFRLFANELQLT